MNLYRRSTWTLLAIASSVSLVQPVSAASVQSNLNVTAQVNPTCRLTTTGVNFGTIDPTLGSSFLATGGLSVTCTAGTSWSATADVGQNPVAVGEFSVRSMRGQTSSAAVKYHLATDAARTQAWAGTTAITGVGTGSVQNQSVYGATESGQTSTPVDNYSDIVVVNLAF